MKTNRVRRLLTLSASMLGIALLASGCTTAAGGQGASESAAAYTVTDAMGEVEFAGTPQRVVALDSPALDALIALGVTPVGASEIREGTGFPDYLAAELSGTESVGTIMEPNLEAIAELDPDLILGSKVRHEEVYDQLSAIAPTVFAADSGTNWTEQATLTAAAVDRAEEMDTLLDDLYSRASAVGAEVGAKGTTASMVRFRTESFRLYGPETFSGSILTDMGFDLGDRDWNEYSMMELSPERYELIDGDVVFHTGAGADAEATTQSTVTELWGGQPAVAAGKVFHVEDDTWMVGIGVIGGNLIVDDVQAALG